MNLTFNIIYTPGTVRFLSLFIFSLLRWSDCKFRLIANGSRSEESEMLKRVCDEHPRLEFNRLPSSATAKHGHVLDYLLKQECSEYFCFMDSDIFATGEFISELLTNLDGNSAVFSCSPLWCGPDEQVLPDFDVRMRGWYNRSISGLCLGSSYFAIYDTKVLTNIVEDSNITFRRYDWKEVPTQYQQDLIHLGLRKNIYDTGKLLNLLLLIKGEKLVIRESPVLTHLGGMSNRILSDHAGQRTLETILKNVSGELSEEGAGQLLESLKRREAILIYFGQLLKYLFENNRKPTLPEEVRSTKVKEKMRRTTEGIENLYEEFGEILSDYGAN